MKKMIALLLVCLLLATLSVTAFADTQNGELLDIAQVMVKAAMNKAERRLRHSQSCSRKGLRSRTSTPCSWA